MSFCELNNPLPVMKHDDERDPLEEKKFEQQKEEKDQSSGGPVASDPGEESAKTHAGEPASEPTSEPASESESSTEPADESEPAAEPADESEPAAESEPADEPVSEPASDDEPQSETESGSEPASDAASASKKSRSRITIRLIDDQEERMRNDSYDELEGDGDENQEGREEGGDHGQPDNQEEEERANYTLLSKEDLVKLLREKLDNPGKFNLRREVQEIRDAFYLHHNASMEEKKKKFLEEGGNEEDFRPMDDPLETELKELLKEYRNLKAEHTKKLEKTKLENLQKKQAVLEEFRVLMEGQERFENTFRKFKDLQKKWFSIGVVPQQNLKDLWDSYNYFVDKFNDYVRINRELRALDLKKNLELKIQLCEKTEALENESNILQAFRTLQKYHTRWREIGPVPRENREELWERFKNASQAINRKHQDFHSRVRESLLENLERKKELCEKVEAIAEKEYHSHGAWAEQTNKILEIQKSWKAIGYAPKKENNAVYSRFRRACDRFFEKKAVFYASVLEEQKDNLKLKTEIAEKAEQLSDSENWKDATNELIRLQRRWKEIGKVPRKDADRLWKRFRAACDRFFDRKSRYFENIDSTFEENLKAKQELIAEMEAYAPVEDHGKNLEAVESFQSRFSEIGYVPAGKKDAIRDQYRIALERLMKKAGMDELERSIFRFRNRVKGMQNSPRARTKLGYERDKLVDKLQQLRNDIGLWENNIGFIKQSESSEDTIQGYNERIESAHRRIKILETKIRILDDAENEN